jgi:hypothetical protein
MSRRSRRDSGSFGRANIKALRIGFGRLDDELLGCLSGEAMFRAERPVTTQARTRFAGERIGELRCIQGQQ